MNKYIFYDKSELDAEAISERDMERVVAKNIRGKQLNRYYLRVTGNSVVNPIRTFLAELDKEDVVFVEVSEEHYELYLKALHGKTRTSFTSIGRLINA
jgi:hypothetical protein